MIGSRNTFPKLMGVLNITPDSFSDGAFYFNPNSAINHALELIDEGADIIDIGGESTRPGADEVSEPEELSRVIPVVKELKKLRPNTQISIDTTKYEVAKQSLDLGVEIINDISGLNFEIRLAELAKQFDAGLVIMHIKGKPRVMQVNPTYDDLIQEIYIHLSEKIDYANSLSLNKLWYDVGIGFGKTAEDNITLLKNLDKFDNLNAKQLLGISRKSFIGKLLNVDSPLDRDLPTLLIHSLLLKNNIDIIRVHSIKEYIMLRNIFDLLQWYLFFLNEYFQITILESQILLITQISRIK